MSAGQSQQFCVRWNSHLGSLGAAFPQLLAGQRFVDVTLACEGHQVHCHRLVLAACSTYFENLLGENPCQHPIIILPRDIKLWAIQALVDFMYKGEVNVSQAGLPDLMKCAEILKIRGLCGSDALNLNQIHSPTGSFNHHQQQQQNSADSDAGDKNAASTKPSDGSSAKQTSGQFQPQYDQNPRAQQSSTSSGPKGHLLSSLRLQPVVMRGHHQQHQQDEGNTSDNGGDSGNEICIKTEDLMIDEETNSKQCEDDDERDDDNYGSDKMPADAIRCEQLLHVHAGMDVEDAVDDQEKRGALQVQVDAEQEAEGEEKEEENRLTLGSLDGGQGAEQQHEPDYEHYAAGSEQDDEDDEVLEVREETEGTPARQDGASNKEARRKRRRRSTGHSDNNNELSSPSEGGAAGTKAGPQRTNGGARSNQTVPSLTSLTGTKAATGGTGGSIRVKPIENLFANYHQTKQSPKSSREKKRAAALLAGTSEGNNSENESASDHVNGVPSALVYNRNEMDIYITPQKQQKRLMETPGDPEAHSDGAVAAMAEGDGYENIICSPNFPQLTGVVGGYKAEDDDEEDDYGDEYAIQLLAEEIDSNMLANGGADSEADEILYKPPPLMAIDGKGSVKPSSLRSYGRDSVAHGNGATSTLTIRKIERQARGGGVSQSNSLARSSRPRPRLMAHSKEGALHQLIKSNGTPPPIAFTLRNPRGNQPRTYNTEALWAALMDVKAGESIYRASQMHKVPRKTLRNWMKRWDIKSAYPMPRQLKEAAEKKRIIKELTSQIQ
uniref:BTB domain-containing protein n=1 Tax=Anopheles atroparvus TaxID=41427 RepID=A0AAG5CSP4_ANOAO